MFCDQYSTVERYGNVIKGLVSAVEQYLNLYQAFLNQVGLSFLSNSMKLVNWKLSSDPHSSVFSRNQSL